VAALLDLQAPDRLASRLGDALPEGRVGEGVFGVVFVSLELVAPAVAAGVVAEGEAALELDAADVERAVVRGVARERGVEVEVDVPSLLPTPVPSRAIRMIS
jgi:hypothetical protein